MAVWAIVPVKPLRRGKSRLSSVLGEDSREALNHCLLENTLETLKSMKSIEEVLVISRDPKALALARKINARTIQESGAPELNKALERATMFSQRFAVHSILIIPADIPLINSLDIAAVLNAGKKPPVVVLVPDRHRRGTNAMLVSPPGLFRYQYGQNSFQAHALLASEMGARLEIIDRSSLALDLDLPEDLEIVKQQASVLPHEVIDLLASYHPHLAGENGRDELVTNPCIETIRSLEIGGSKNDGK